MEYQQWDEGMKRAQRGMDDLQKSTGGMDAVMGKAMKRMGAMAAAWASVDVAAKAFNKTIAGSQTLTDEWGRTMQAGTRVVDGFFESLAQGSFQSFLGGLDSMIAKAREAYDAIDALGTYDIFAGPLKAKYEYQIRKLKYEIRAGVGNADEKKEQIREIEDKMLGLAGRESQLSGSAASKLLASFASANGGMDTLEELFMSGDQAQNVALAKYEELKKKYSQTVEVEKVVGTTSFGMPIMGKGEVTQWVSEEIREQAETLKTFGEMSDEKLQEVANLYVRQYRSQSEVYAKKMENLKTLRYKGPGGGAGGYAAQKFELAEIEKPKLGQTTSMEELKSQLRIAEEKLERATTSIEATAAETEIADLNARIEAQPLALKLDLPEEEVARIQEEMDALSIEMSERFKPIEVKVEAEGGKNPVKKVSAEVETLWQNLGNVSSAFGNVGVAMQTLEDPSAKIAGIVMGAVANVVQSFAVALASEKNIWSWIAAAAAGTATVMSTVSSIKSVTEGSYAEGGVVTGGAYAGDAVPIMANAGEVVLNAAQQQNLAGQLQPREMGSDRQPYVSGEVMFLGMSNYLRRSGRGEMVTTR